MVEMPGTEANIRMKSFSGRKALIGPSTFGAVDRRPLNLLIEVGLDIVENPFKRKLTRDEVSELLATGVTALIAGLEPLDREILERSKLRVISRCGSGLSNIDLVAARELGIKVCSTPDGPTNAVAELTLAAMLNLVRGIPEMNEAMHAGLWRKTIGAQLEGKTVVIVGFGRIGRQVAELLVPFGANLVAVDPALPGQVGGISVYPLTEALPMADLVTVHASGEAEILGEKEFRLLKRGVLLLNCSRGGVISEAALRAFLDDGTVAGAWLDCFTEEPYHGPLIAYPQVLMTPHAGSYTRECRLSMETEAAQNLIDALREL